MSRVFWASGSSEVAISKSGKAPKRVYRQAEWPSAIQSRASDNNSATAIVCRLRSCVYESLDRLCNTLR